jgi:hypothetical protein
VENVRHLAGIVIDNRTAVAVGAVNLRTAVGIVVGIRRAFTAVAMEISDEWETGKRYVTFETK